jgi:hypothetical protein
MAFKNPTCHVSNLQSILNVKYKFGYFHYYIKLGLSRVRMSTAVSAGRPNASDDPTDVRLADGEAVGRRD